MIGKPSLWLYRTSSRVAQNTDPKARVLVFIDGQNVYKACERLYGHGPCHPLLLAARLAGARTLVGVRFYSGVHDPTVNSAGRSRSDRRHNLMRRVGVTVIERQLRYRWEWGFDPAVLPDPRKNLGRQLQVAVTPYQRAREKGIDLAIGLDVVDLALQGLMDVAVVVSSDNDLCEAARATHQATVAGDRVSVEAGVFNENRRPILMQHYDYTHQLRYQDFDAARDSNDYRNPVPQVMQDMFVATCAPLRNNLF
jgi:uncharacterized LabA/DUF88 family protein